MNEAVLERIYHYHRLSNLIATAGQPAEEELATIAEADFEVVVNLALHGAEYSLPDERRTVETLGMRYIHIPVVWERPLRSDLEQFFKVMDQLSSKRVFGHCAANERVSVLMALYRQLRQGWSPDSVMPDVLGVREPDALRRQFMDEIASKMSG